MLLVTVTVPRGAVRVWPRPHSRYHALKPLEGFLPAVNVSAFLKKLYKRTGPEMIGSKLSHGSSSSSSSNKRRRRRRRRRG